MRGNGGGKKGEWPRVIKKEEKYLGGEKEGVPCQRKRDYKKEGKRERRKREKVKSYGRKKRGGRGFFWGQGSEECSDI